VTEAPAAVVVDTSALMAVLLGEADAPRCAAALAEAPGLVLSAGTLAEALIVAEHRGIGAEMAELVAALGAEVAPVTAATARRVAAAHLRWGKGRHPAGLNFGDCFAAALAEERGAPVLFTGADFSRTDLRAA
jgi:ribonuclease VapC